MTTHCNLRSLVFVVVITCSMFAVAGSDAVPVPSVVAEVVVTLPVYRPRVVEKLTGIPVTGAPALAGIRWCCNLAPKAADMRARSLAPLVKTRGLRDDALEEDGA